jgi:predicted metal-dependent peptidase
MPESDQKPSATTRSKTQAFDLEALQLLVASTTQNVAALTTSVTELKETFALTDKKVSKVMKKMEINQAIQDDRQDLTTKSIAHLQTTIETQPDTIANTVRNDLRNDIDDLRDKIRDGRFQHEQEVLRNDDLQTELDKLKLAPTTTRAKSSSSFPRFSTSYGGIRSPVPADMTADTYYQDVTPADHNIQGSYIDPATPMPTGLTGSTDAFGAPQRGLLSLVGNSQINISKFQEKIAKLTLRDDSVTAVRDWFHGIRLALNTSGKTHIDVLPMFEMLKMSDRFSTLLLPVDAFGDIDTTASSYSLCLNMYHTFGQVLLTEMFFQNLRHRLPSCL